MAGSPRCARALLVALAVGAAACTASSTTDVVPTSDQTTVAPTPTADAVPTPTADALPCPDLALGRPFATVADPALTEISGAVASPTTPDRVWVHEDSGTAPVLHQLTLGGATEATWQLDGVDAVDWEDIAALPSPPALLVGDIGDNRRVRTSVVVHRLAEPATSGTGPPDATIELRLPTPTNAEALLVDPRSGDLVVVTKDLAGDAEVLVAAGVALADDGTVHTMEVAGTLSLGLLAPVLAGDVAPDGHAVALRTPSDVLWWTVGDDESLADALLGRDPCRLPSTVDVYGEALAILSAPAGYLLLGEGTNPAMPVAR
ncbi:hypothetical protein [Actinomarinicola tropica]|uniref:hypothetical protein n=1 Tax=Actinomarinicola tropica TaxID=2789776 RepID=UPI001E5A700A|nr:hypothetical protein [Actinomarinicola tropica]